MDMDLKKIRIRMNRSFKDFIQNERKIEFLSDLSFITGVPEDCIHNTVFRKGCVIFEGELDSAAVQRLIESYKERNSNGTDEDIQNIREFVSTHAVVEITDDFRIRVSVKTDKKTDRKDRLRTWLAR